MRRPILAANWKMFKTADEAQSFALDFLPRVAGVTQVEIVLIPPFTALERLGAALAGSAVQLGAQNVHAEEQGAFTGEIAAGMLANLGCRYAVVGHSERRSLFGESDAQVAAKAQALLRHGIRPIVCVGETLAQRESGQALAVVAAQLEGSLAGLEAARCADLVVAYEPVWAIGTGRTATPEIAQEVHAAIRAALARRFGPAGREIRIQYGGSVKADNVDRLMAQPDIDGALVGGASLDPATFARIVRFEAGESL